MSQWTGFLIFFSVVTSIYSATHYYIYRLFIRFAEPSRTLRRIVGLLFLFLVIAFPVSRILSWFDFNAFNYFLALTACTWMGLALYLFIFALGSDALFLVFRVLRVNPWRAWENPRSAKRWFLAAVVGCVFLIGVVALWEARDIRVTRLDIPLANLPKDLDGFSIVQISDFHYGVLNLNRRLDKVVNLANGLHADMIVITGDLVDESVAHMEEMAPSLARLKCRVGIYAVTGNHDYYAGVQRVTRIMREAHIKVLRNELEVLPGGLQILGIDDPTGTRRMGEPGADFEKLVGGVDPSKPSILLYHQPIQFEKTAKAGIGLQLSGHTHGGQLYPIIYISQQIYPWTPGLHQIGNSYLYVSKGAGTWGPPMRFFAPPEIVHIRLKAER
jgi:uncharacterized protein